MKNSDGVFLIGMIVGIAISTFVDANATTKSRNNYKNALVENIELREELQKCNDWVRFLEDDTEQGKRISFLEFEVEGCVSNKRNYYKWLETKIKKNK